MGSVFLTEGALSLATEVIAEWDVKTRFLVATHLHFASARTARNRCHTAIKPAAALIVSLNGEIFRGR